MQGIRKVPVIAALFFFTLSLSFTGSAQPKAGGATGSAIAIGKPKRSADLRVDGIYADSCACDLSGIDAMYMRNITVHFSGTIKFTAGPADVIATLKVTYFDLMKGRLETKKVMLQANHLNKGSGAVLMISGAVLIKKSIGVTAEISPAGLVEVDPNLANNSKKVTDCNVLLI